MIDIWGDIMKKNIIITILIFIIVVLGGVCFYLYNSTKVEPREKVVIKNESSELKDSNIITDSSLAINNSEVFLFMYSSAHSKITDYKNDWTIRELDFAQHKKKRIVFVNVDSSELTDWFYMLFGTMQQVDATNTQSIDKI